MSRRNWKHQSETGNKEGREKALSTDQKKTITSQQQSGGQRQGC